MATASASEPRGYLVVFGERLQREAVMTDRSHAEGYAANSHGICLRLYLSQEDADLLSAMRTARESPEPPR